MNKQIIIPREIVTADQKDTILRNHIIIIEDGIIEAIEPADKFDFENYKGIVHEYPDLTLIPGFVQTHIHLCQTLFRGLADDLQLLDWLQFKIFPYENAHNKSSLRSSAQLGLHELQTGGTTTILDMGTVNHQEVVFEELLSSGMRAVAGKCMIDRNDLFESFKESTEDSLKSSYELAKAFHNKSDKIKYGFAPRFVLSCSEELLKETHSMQQDFEGAIFHTHSSENKNEVEEVRRLTGKENIEYFNHIGVLDDHTVLAHCIHLNDQEVHTLKTRGGRVSHCPSSNMKLGSGIANIPRYLREGISVSLGADGAPCNNNLSIFQEMRLASLMQKPIHGATSMDAKTVFRLSNIEGAKALNLESEIGSIEPGKKADLVLMNLEGSHHPSANDNESIYSSIVYSARQNDVRGVLIGGEWIVRNGEHLFYDESEITGNAKSELKNLLNRV